MEANADIELESENSLSASPRPQRKNITIKLKSKNVSSGRRKSNKAAKVKKENNDHPSDDEIVDTPIFKTMEPGEPHHKGHRLNWNHKVNLLGEKVVDPLIHCCEKCSLPILIYGRMIQCKHVFCFNCAKKTEKVCPRCEEQVQRIEQSALGTVFLCTYGGAKHGTDGCRRTYLSQRDLNAHIGHRHLKSEVKPDPAKSQARAVQQPKQQAPVLPPASHQPMQMDQYSQNTRQTADAMRSSAPVAMPVRAPHEDMVFQRSQEMSHMQLSSVMSSAGMMPPQPQPQMAHQTQVRQSLPHPFSQGLQQPPPTMSPQNVVPQGGMGQQQQQQGMPGIKQSLPPQPAMVPQPQQQQPQPQQMPPVSSHESFMSSIPVMGGRTNLITVPIQDDDYRRKQEQAFHQSSQPSGMPPVPFPTQRPPPPIGHLPQAQQAQYPPVSMNPNIHQPPPSVLPISHSGMFSSQSIQQGGHMQNPIYTSPMSRPPPGTVPHPGVPPPMSNALPPPMAPRPGVQPPRIAVPSGQPPPRFSAPPGHYDDSQNPRYSQPGQQHSPRMPWTGPPPVRGPPPTVPPPGTIATGGQMTHPPPQRPQSDYNQYY